MGLITLKRNDLVARINEENQQLCSLEHLGLELMHPGGSPTATAEERGWWPNSEIVMFPVVGPVKDNEVAVPGGSGNYLVPMTQHGIARHIPFRLMAKGDYWARSVQSYRRDTPVHSKKSPVPLRWPFSYSIDKLLKLTEDGLVARFSIFNESDEDMPYEFGWHPAFRTFEANGQLPGQLLYHQTLADGMLPSRVGETTVERLQESGTLKFDGHSCTYSNGLRSVNFEEEDGHDGSIEHMMLWSPQGSKLVCLEPVTKLPDGTHFEYGYGLLKPGHHKTFGYHIWAQDFQAGRTIRGV